MALVSAKVVAAACGVRQQGTVLAWARAGIIPCVPLGKQRRFDLQAVKAALRDRQTPGPTTCTKCGDPIPPGHALTRTDPRCSRPVVLGHCRACHLAYKAERRRVQAQAQGKVYRSLQERATAREETARQRAATRSARAAERLKKPKETGAQAYRRRYREDPEFYRKERARLWAKKRRRRAIEKGAPKVERIHVLDVAQRDGWRCAICSKRVTRKTWSIDHLVPLSKGGAHTMRNVVLAHKRCNSRRGVGRLPSQASLFPGGCA